MSNRFTLYGVFLSGPTYKVGLMLSLSGQPFAYRHINLREGAHKTPEYLAINRYGQVPALRDESDSRVFVQSAVILEVLADRLGKFGGADRWERIEAREWMFWDFDRLAPQTYRLRGQALGFRNMAKETVEMYQGEAKLAYTMLDKHLTGREFMVGSAPSIADIDIYGVLAYAAPGGIVIDEYPAIAAFMKRIEALPGFGTPEEILPKADRA